MTGSAMEDISRRKQINPWAWVPTLYFAEGIPYFIVNVISVIMFKNMGMSNGDIAMYTGLLYLPWTIKPLWSPFVDIIRTKRWWIVVMQAVIAVSFLLAALSLPHPPEDAAAAGKAPVSLFVATLVIFWITAFASATHDIAADGYYMIALDQKQQSLRRITGTCRGPGQSPSCCVRCFSVLSPCIMLSSCRRRRLPAVSSMPFPERTGRALVSGLRGAPLK